MAAILILSPIDAVSVTSSRGTGEARLLSRSPKEQWADSVSGSAVMLTLDLGTAQPIDALFLGTHNGADASTWAISSGVAAPGETAWTAAVRFPAPYRNARLPRMSYYRRAAPIVARYITATLSQPAGSAPLAIGTMAAGLTFSPIWGNEYGGGRQPIDTGLVESLPDGGFGVRDGVVKRVFRCTLGDLQELEVDALEAIYLDKGGTRPVLVIEGSTVLADDPIAERFHWGRFAALEAWERLDPLNTRWQLTVEEWR